MPRRVIYKNVKNTFISVKGLPEGSEYYIYSTHTIKDCYIFKLLDNNFKPLHDQEYSGNSCFNTNEDNKHIYENNTQTQPIDINTW